MSLNISTTKAWAKYWTGPLPARVVALGVVRYSGSAGAVEGVLMRYPGQRYFVGRDGVTWAIPRVDVEARIAAGRLGALGGSATGAAKARSSAQASAAGRLGAAGRWLGRQKNGGN